MEREPGATGSSIHFSNRSHWQAWMVSFLSAVGPKLVLGEKDGGSDFVSEGGSEGETDCDGGLDGSNDGPGDLVGEYVVVR